MATSPVLAGPRFGATASPTVALAFPLWPADTATHTPRPAPPPRPAGAAGAPARPGRHGDPTRPARRIPGAAVERRPVDGEPAAGRRNPVPAAAPRDPSSSGRPACAARVR